MSDTIKVSEHIQLNRLQESDAEALFALSDRNREVLRQWLPWVEQAQTSEDTLYFIRTTIAQYDHGFGPQYAIHHRGELAGTVGFHPFDQTNRIAEIGYWLATEHQGQGIMTACCAVLVRLAFDTFGMNRVQIPAAEQNVKSRAIPERLGFTFEGILRERECLYGRFVNHAMYSLLRSEYLATGTDLAS